MMNRFVLVALLLLICASRADAQLPADASWRTLETANFRVTYHSGLEDLARHAGAAAERTHAALQIMVGRAPAGRIDVVVTDHLDVTNGWATPFPSNRIAIFARPPVDILELQYTRDWVEVVITHELAHIFHLDASGAAGRLVRSVFGRVPMPWPVFSNVLTPLWSIEGLAVGVESALTGFGRVNGSYHEMVVRTAALESRIDDLDRLGSSAAAWPGPARAYIYGSLFMDYLTRRYGPEAASRLVRSTAGAIIPPSLWFNGVARDALGVSFRDAYRDWTAELDVRYRALAARVAADGLTDSQPLTTHGRYAMHPRFSRDGRFIAYARADGRTPASVAVMDAAGGEVQWSRRGTGTGSFTWLPDNSLIVSELEHVDRHRIFSDLYLVRRGERTRLTHNARLHAPDATADGRTVVAIETAGGTNRLVLLDPQSGAIQALTHFDPDVHWALPRWAPDGSRLAVSRWRTGGQYDLVVMDAHGAVHLEVSEGIGINAAATWSPDGQWLLFGSDRSGIPNIYAVAVEQASAQNGGAGPRLRQVTNVLTGAFHPDISPDGRTLVFSRYHDDGYSVEQMPFAPQAWRDPQPAALRELATERGFYETASDPAQFADSIRAAIARADTTVRSEQAYRDLFHMRPHYWLPILEDRARQGFVGVYTSGADLVDRHQWFAGVAVAPSSGRSAGGVGYTYRGLPTVRGLGVHPTIGGYVRRDWERIATDTVADYYVDRREDVAALTLGLEHVRVRMAVGGSVAGEYLHRARHKYGAPALQLAKPSDDLLGVTASTHLMAYVMPPLSVSRENGVALQLTGRKRWDMDAVPGAAGGALLAGGGGYRELTSSTAAYVALPLPGFSRHVLAVRGSLLLRDGPGATTSPIGSISGSAGGEEDDDDPQPGRASRLLPLRGFHSGVRAGTRAWTASGEYRFPLAMMTRTLRPLPIFIDRLGGTLFADAGDAWCAPEDADRLGAACTSSAATGAPLVSAGGELLFFASFYGLPVPVRVGAGVPLRGGADRTARAYITTGLSF